jgi:RHS repeat-associated protein
VWRWDQGEPFGNNPAEENPSGLGAFDLPLRLPGQRYDAETGLHYNYYRDYAPEIGRYIQSDRIGLIGGLNTYIYAYDPTGQIDPLGLMGRPPGKGQFPPGQGPGTIPGYSCAAQLLASTTFAPGASDKHKHCVLSCKIALQCGTLTSMSAGVGKEIADLFGPGNAEWEKWPHSFRQFRGVS